MKYFLYINSKINNYTASGNPVFSIDIDTKKRKLFGNFKNQGRR
ncbi:MAG: hypothetical protein LBP22_07860 [Deltaproteobacteria bacterium]|nr:hypothetical protein [Deltaproteobacteria bacterium]